MTKKAVTPDSGEHTDWGSHAQTQEPWKGNPEKEQRSGQGKLDLEKWHDTNANKPLPTGLDDKKRGE